MTKTEQLRVIREAYTELDRLNMQDGFFEVAQRLFDMNVKAERQHRKGTPNGCTNHLGINDAAKLFVVKHLLDGWKEPNRFGVDAILHIRTEVLYAQAYAAKHRVELAEWAVKWLKPFAEVDYAALMKSGRA